MNSKKIENKKLTNFTFILTDACNFDCSYCYQSKKRKHVIMESSMIEKSIDFFAPSFEDGCYVTFYGGEPLMAFDRIKETVAALERKKLKLRVQYGLTTNGSLLNDENLDFMNRHQFAINVSFDGIAQELSRKKGSYAPVLANLKKALTYPGIKVSTNSVFTPETAAYLAGSMQSITSIGVTDATFSLSTLTPWDNDSLGQLERELDKLKKYSIAYYRKHGSVPITTLRQPPKIHGGIFGCAGGNSRMALSPDGILWGCFLFWDFYKEKKDSRAYRRFCFGLLDEFIEHCRKEGMEFYREILDNYAALRMDYACCGGNFCMLCEDLESCMICPVNAALSGAPIGDVPVHVCQLFRIRRQARVVIDPADAPAVFVHPVAPAAARDSRYPLPAEAG